MGVRSAKDWKRWAEEKFWDSLIDSDFVGQMIFEAVAEEREACAKAAERVALCDASAAGPWGSAGREIAGMIRGRSQADQDEVLIRMTPKGQAELKRYIREAQGGPPVV